MNWLIQSSMALEQIRPHLEHLDPRVKLVERDGATIFHRTGPSGALLDPQFAVAIGIFHYFDELPLLLLKDATPSRACAQIADRVKLAVEKLVWHVDRLHARDVVEGWPRGRSTSGHSEPLLYPWQRSSCEHVNEFIQNCQYRTAQARMMDDWHRSGGIAPSEYAQAKFTGRLIEVKQ